MVVFSDLGQVFCICPHSPGSHSQSNLPWTQEQNFLKENHDGHHLLWMEAEPWDRENENAAWWDVVVAIANVRTDVPPHSAFMFTGDFALVSTLCPPDSAVGRHSTPHLGVRTLGCQVVEGCSPGRGRAGTVRICASQCPSLGPCKTEP